MKLSLRRPALVVAIAYEHHKLALWASGYQHRNRIGLALQHLLDFVGNVGQAPLGPFDALLGGAREADDHFRSAPFERNIPALMGLIGVWYANFFGAEPHAVPISSLFRRVSSSSQAVCRSSAHSTPRRRVTQSSV